MSQHTTWQDWLGRGVSGLASLGADFARRGELDAAIAAFEMALEVKPEARYAATLASVEREVGKAKEARAHFLLAAKLFSRDADKRSEQLALRQVASLSFQTDDTLQ